MDDFEYVVIQAGGKGTRLKHLTKNKPKALVSIDNLPIIFHLFRKYPNKKFIIIGDYLKEVLDAYLDVFCDVPFITVGTDGKSGTCAGILNALDCIPDGKRFILIWSDLILGTQVTIVPSEHNQLGISGNFACRWSYECGNLQEVSSLKKGVAGLFVFTDKSVLSDIPLEGEFVRWLSTKHILFDEVDLTGSVECGQIENLKKQQSGRCRPFNSMHRCGNHLYKEGIDEQGRKLAVREKAWYKHVSNYDVPIPTIYSYNPLEMEWVDGKNIFEYALTDSEKKLLLEKLVKCLQMIHNYDSSPVDRFSMYEAYFTKTMSRLSKIRDLVPFAKEPYIKINGRNCRNVFFHISELRNKLKNLPCTSFCLIHGDCTFSNILLKNGCEPLFIDPRGYFGHSELVGDPAYDWAKLYYSIVGDYDQFNLGRFELDIKEDSVELQIATNGWKSMEPVLINLISKYVDIKDIRLIHSIIWLSLTTYAWDDYDSICGAFYNGLYYLEASL